MRRSEPNEFFVGFAFIWLALILSACSTKAANIRTASELGRGNGETSIVFGRIQWLEDGKEKEIGKGLLAMSLAPHLMKMEDKTRIIGEISEGGNFVWSLKAGSYLIHKIAYRDSWSGNYFFVPKVAFSVPENGKVYYVGVLRSEFEKKRDLIGGLSGTAKFTIQDEGDRDLVNFQDNFSIASNEIDKSLMVRDSRFPRTVETTEEFNLAVSIMNAILFGISQ